MALLTRKRTVLVEIESTYGTDPSPTGSANAILVKNLSVEALSVEAVQRDNIRAYMGNFDTLIAGQNARITFDVEMAGSGAAGTAPNYGPCLKACGLSETVNASTNVIYAPVSTGMSSVTIYFNVDGIRHKITGARGNVELNIAAKQIPTFSFSFTGIYNAAVDEAAPSADYTGFQVPKVASTTNTTGFSFYSYAGVLASMNFNAGNEVNHRQLIGAESVDIVDRRASGSVVIEAPLLATKDFFAIANAGTTGALSITHGTVAGNKVKLDAPRVSIAGVSYQDDAGIQMLSIPFNAAPVTGGDDFTITVL